MSNRHAKINGRVNQMPIECQLKNLRTFDLEHYYQCTDNRWERYPISQALRDGQILYQEDDDNLFTTELIFGTIG